MKIEEENRVVEYFIKLKPLNPFYFGSTKSFDDNRVNENYKKPYFLKGNLYPQQTAILGMLRKKILEDNGILVENVKRNNEQKNKEKEYIGKITNDLSKSTFGKIENISSVQIYVEDMPYYYYEDNKEEKKAKFCKEKNFTNRNGEKKLLKYNSKNFGEYFKRFENGNRKSKDEIFTEVIEFGIDKQKKEEEDNSLFKKQRYLFKEKNIYFGLYVVLKDTDIKNGFVQLGDKYSIFYLEVEEKEKKLEIDENRDNNLILFTSDMYIEQDDLSKLLELSEGMILKNNKFKFINDDNNKFYKNKKSQNLIKRGSILISNKEILDILKDKKYENYKKVGFNDYKIIRGDE